MKLIAHLSGCFEIHWVSIMAPIRTEVLLQLAVINSIPAIAALIALQREGTFLNFMMTIIALAISYFVWFAILYNLQPNGMLYWLYVKFEKLDFCKSNNSYINLASRIASTLFFGYMSYMYIPARILLSGYLCAQCVQQGSSRGISVALSGISSLNDAQSVRDDHQTELSMPIDPGVLLPADDEVALAWYRGETQSGIRHANGLTRRGRNLMAGSGPSAALLASSPIPTRHRPDRQRSGVLQSQAVSSPVAVGSPASGSGYRAAYRAEVAQSAQKQLLMAEQLARERRGHARHRRQEHVQTDSETPNAPAASASASGYWTDGGIDSQEVADDEDEYGRRVDGGGKRKFPEANIDDNDEDGEAGGDGGVSMDMGDNRGRPRRKRVNISASQQQPAAGAGGPGSGNMGSFWNQVSSLHACALCDHHLNLVCLCFRCWAGSCGHPVVCLLLAVV
jgi:hypothetical protein